MDDASLIAHEREKYEKMWEFKEYRGNRGNVAQAARFVRMARMKRGDTVMDIGSGPGYASRKFHDLGMRVIAVDIADNALTPENRALVEFHRCSIWELPEGVSADFGFCTDTMEHIPTEKVDDTLAVIRRAVRGPVYFEVSLRKDGCGRLINDVLHLTVRPLEWWEEALRRCWGEVEVIAIDFRAKSAVLLASQPVTGG